MSRAVALLFMEPLESNIFPLSPGGCIIVASWEDHLNFLTWFERALQSADAFEKLVERLRATKEWDYVDREVDIRLSRE